MNEPETNKQNRKPNRLINEMSPYFLQHAYNPVDWFPWEEEGFRKQEKKINQSFFHSDTRSAIGLMSAKHCNL